MPRIACSNDGGLLYNSLNDLSERLIAILNGMGLRNSSNVGNVFRNLLALVLAIVINLIFDGLKQTE